MNLPEVSNTPNSTLSQNIQRSAYSSVTKIMPGSRYDIGGSVSATTNTKASKKKNRSKPYEPIRLPEDILTIQAHTASTPVTELPYLLIAAHIGALPTARQFYPATSATHSPLTVFRDMFVMTIDVRGYKPSSVRLSTEGRLIIIECLQSEVPQVVFTQTGTVDTNNKYLMDPTPKVNELPVHTSFNYVQHRVKLPEDFSEEGLKVGMDDVSGHVIITGRLVHNQKAAFPEPWNQNKVVKKPKGPLVNTSNANLSKEDARKLAAWNAVQGNPQGKLAEIENTNFMAYGKKQWLEKEGAKLRAIQHRALKENIRKLTELKKGYNGPTPTANNAGYEASPPTLSAKNIQEKLSNEHKVSQRPRTRSNSSSQLSNILDGQQERTPGTDPNDATPEFSTGIPPGNHDSKTLNKTSTGKSEGSKTPMAKSKDSRPKVSFQSEMKYPLPMKKSQVKTDANPKKRTPQKMNQKNLRKKSKIDERRKPGKAIKLEGNSAGGNASIEPENPSEIFGLQSKRSNSAPAPSPTADITRVSKSRQSLDSARNNPEGEGDNKSSAESAEADPVTNSSLPNASRENQEGETEDTQNTKVSETPEEMSKINELSEGTSVASEPQVVAEGPVDVPPRKSKSQSNPNVTKSKANIVTSGPTVSQIKDPFQKKSVHKIEHDDGYDPVGKEDKVMWERLLNFAGVRRRQKPKSRSPSPDPKN